MDHLLFQTKGPTPKYFWRPGEGRSIAPDPPVYQPFDHIVRTVHIEEALQICQENGMPPKKITSPSILNVRWLSRQYGHPCRNIRVLWFGTQSSDDKKHDWYGNIQFAVPVDTLMRRWKYYYLVEVMTAKTHTTTRVLATNKDYSNILPFFDPYKDGSPWHIDSYGHHYALSNCSRYNNEGYNNNGHKLEFMIEVTPLGQRNILKECLLSFRDHSLALDSRVPLRCHRTQFRNETCPSPVSISAAARIYFYQHERMCNVSPIATPRLCEEAEYYLHSYYSNEIDNRDNNDHSLNQTHPNQVQMVPQFQPPPIPREPTYFSNNIQNIPDVLLRGSLQHMAQTYMEQVGNNSRLFAHESIQGPFGLRMDQYFQQTTTNPQGQQGRESLGNRVQEIGTNTNIIPQQGMLQEISGITDDFQRQVINAWWLSLNDYCRSIMMWYSSQTNLMENLQILGWPTPQQHQHHRRRRRCR